MPADISAFEAEIRALREASNRAIARRDIRALAEHFDPSFIVTAGNGGHLLSRQAVLEAFADEFSAPSGLRYLRTAEKVEIASPPELASEQGRWLATAPDGGHVFAGTYMAMWRRAADGWKLRSELFVTLRSFQARNSA